MTHNWGVAYDDKCYWICIIIMNTNLSHLKNLRIYQHLPFVQLVSHLVCNRVMQSKLLVDGAPLLYRWAKYFPGKTITNWIIGQTFNKMFTGGHSFEELKQASAHLMHLSTIDFMEGFLWWLIFVLRVLRMIRKEKKFWMKMPKSLLYLLSSLLVILIFCFL